MTGGWKQKSGWIQIPPASGVPFTFPFLSQPSVCLIVSRVRAYLTTDQQHGIPCVRIQTVRLRLVRGLRKTLSQIPPTSYPVSARDKCNAKRRDGDEKE